MRLVAGQKYVRGPAGEIMPYTPGVEKIKGCEVFVQKSDQADSLQLPENENMPKFRGRRMVDIITKAPADYAEVEKPQATETVVVKRTVKAKPTPVQAQKFEHMDIREEMDYDLKQEKDTSELAELE